MCCILNEFLYLYLLTNYNLFSDVFITQLTALKTSRSVKTRRLTLAEESSEMTQTARLAQILHQILKTLVASKGKILRFYLSLIKVILEMCYALLNKI